MISGFARSLSLRLLAIFVLCGALYVYGTVLALRYVYNQDDLRELISGHLSLHVEYVRRDIGSPPDLDRARAITEQVPVDIRIDGPSTQWASDPDFPELAELSFGASDYFSANPDAWLYALENVEFAELDGHRFMKLIQGPYSIIVSTTKIADDNRAPPLIPIIIGMGLLLVLLTYLSVRWLFLPIRAIRAGASRLGRGNFDQPITRVRPDELGDLAMDVNRLASDVQNMLDAKRQLLLGISHELRTPLSRSKLLLEFLPEDSDKEGLNAELAEMDRIIGMLLEAERLNDRHAAIHRIDVDPKRLVEEVVTHYFERDKSRIVIRVESSLPAVSVDEPRVKLLVKNLLSNAIRYSDNDDSPVDVDVQVSRGELLIGIADHGPGFPLDQVDHIGEPFWRGDSSRTRETGGSGLGLYLAKLVTTAHGGTLSLDVDYKEGARFVAIMPV